MIRKVMLVLGIIIPIFQWIIIFEFVRLRNYWDSWRNNATANMEEVLTQQRFYYEDKLMQQRKYYEQQLLVYDDLIQAVVRGVQEEW